MLIKSFHLLSCVPQYLQTGKTMTESKCIRKYLKCLQSMKKLPLSGGLWPYFSFSGDSHNYSQHT